MQFKQAQVGELAGYQVGDFEIPYRDIMHPDGLIRVEYYHDADIENPTAFNMFRTRMQFLQREYEHWKTIGTDSITFMELAARKYEEKVLNPMPPGVMSKYAKGAGVDGRQWHGGSTDALEEMVIMRYASLPMNVVICCHINERRNEISGDILRGPFAPGRLSTRGELAAAFQEQYHQYTLRGDGGREFVIGTQNDGEWVATSQISAPHPCYPHYNSLWAGWQGEQMPIHVMLYGDTGTGKSTFLSTFPKPLLVFLFDPFGKDLPYHKYMEF